MTRSHAPRAAAGPSQRQLRVGELIRHALAEILMRGEVHDPEIEAVTISISEVRMSPDLKLGTCYVAPLGMTGAEEAVAALERNRRFLRGAVAKRINLRHSPELRFRVDDSYDSGARIDALLQSPEVRRDLEADDTSDQDD